MDPKTFAAAEEKVDKIATLVDQKLESASFKDVRDALQRLGEALGPRYSAAMKVTVEVFDSEESRTMPLLTTGFSTSDAKPPYRIWEDSSPQRYLVNGEIQVVPNDRCPKCWESWMFKFEHRNCPFCGIDLGKNCRVLLDSDVCPNCEEGHVSVHQLDCSKCGFKVDPDVISWG